MVGAIIGAVGSLASSIIGAVGSANANRRANNLISTQQANNRAWYDMKRNEDHLTRSENQAVLNKTRELLNEQYKKSRATNIVAGGTDESLALQQQAANETLANTMTNIAGQASAYKDAAEQQYRQTDAALTNQQIAVQQQQSQNIAKAAGQGVQAGLNLMASGIKSDNGLKPSSIPGAVADANIASINGMTEDELINNNIYKSNN